MNKFIIGKEKEQLSVCQNENEWLAYQHELKSKKIVLPDTQVRITSSGGYASQTAETEDVSPLPVDFL